MARPSPPCARLRPTKISSNSGKGRSRASRCKLTDQQGATGDIDAIRKGFEKRGYICNSHIATSIFLAEKLQKPLLVEGPPGVGKTELAKATAEMVGKPLIRLQCYEGLDEAKALYEWDYAKQMLYTQLLREAIAREVSGAPTIAEAAAIVAKSEASFFNEHFLIDRPLLRALRSKTPAVLLIDEVDRADPEFEAFLLEILSELQVTIPELGTIRADPDDPPLVLLTTNATREMTEALRRRCLHAFLDYPPPSREIAILKTAVPGIDADLAARMVAFVDGLRALDLRKAPAISETIDWARAVLMLGGSKLDKELVQSTLGLLLKHQADKADVDPKIEKLLAGTKP